ncbi:LOW QUALITY PROTEIN: uncharacterized protein LOC117610671 [Osmia lignaria lignaria]|uniref:LOW QUALITY PROTEIN: uncharacterized protein LOC117610671 n=1 Tax=Osmia lignaria lignaria TaxID=1437193 RepID=UPI00402B80E6
MDPELLLFEDSLAPRSINLELLTKKLVMLLALATAHSGTKLLLAIAVLSHCAAQRVPSLTKIRISNIKIFDTEIRIKISDRIKTSGPGRTQPMLQLLFFKEQSRLCVATILCQYIKQSAKIRKQGEDMLLLTYKKPHGVATPQSVSRWLKSVMAKSGIDTRNFGSHSTRHASTSAASRRGVDIEAIRRAAGWTEKSNTFTRFYNRPVIKNTSVARSVIGAEIQL